MLARTIPLALCLLAGPAVAAGSAVAAPVVREELRPLEFLVGHCWTTTFADGKTTDTHCFEADLDGHVIRDRHIVRGPGKPYEGTTVYAWDPHQKRITYLYCANDGGMSTGGVAEASGSRITFQESYRDTDIQMTLRSIWTRRGADGYVAVVSNMTKGDWQEMSRHEFHLDAADSTR
jgi:hypothetical protein